MIKDCLKDTDVVVLAGGRGTRVASVLKNKPKILAPLGKRLFIDLLPGDSCTTRRREAPSIKGAVDGAFLGAEQ